MPPPPPAQSRLTVIALDASSESESEDDCVYMGTREEMAVEVDKLKLEGPGALKGNQRARHLLSTLDSRLGEPSLKPEHSKKKDKGKGTEQPVVDFDMLGALQPAARWRPGAQLEPPTTRHPAAVHGSMRRISKKRRRSSPMAEASNAQGHPGPASSCTLHHFPGPILI